MNDLPRLLLLLGLAGTGFTFLGSAALWFMDEERRVRRALRRVLKSEPEAMIVTRGRGRGAGFSFASGLAAVAWDSGAWCLIYRIDELTGAELIVDGDVLARVYRGEARKPLERAVANAGQVTLRLTFDDPHHPDFDLDLFVTGDEMRRLALSPAQAVQEANRWIARAEAILRRPPANRPRPAMAEPERRVAQPAAGPLQSLFDVDDDDDDIDRTPRPPPRSEMH